MHRFAGFLVSFVGKSASLNATETTGSAINLLEERLMFDCEQSRFPWTSFVVLLAAILIVQSCAAMARPVFESLTKQAFLSS